MNKVPVAKRLVSFYTMTQLAAQEGFIQFSLHKTFNSYILYTITFTSADESEITSELPVPPYMKYHKWQPITNRHYPLMLNAASSVLWKKIINDLYLKSKELIHKGIYK